MSSTDFWSPKKIEKYARYRWEYAPDSLDVIFKVTSSGPHSTIADIGAGPGNLAKHFLGKVKHTYLIEPDTAMRQMAEKLHGAHPACHILNGRAEATGLPDHSINLITVGQAIHYFDAPAARSEFIRILKPGGWLAVLRNHGTDEDINAAIEDVYSEENGCDPTIIANRPAWKPMDFYFGGENFQKLAFSFVDIKTREQYISALATASYAPHESHPLYLLFEAAAGEVFDHFSIDGILRSSAETELYLGQIEP